MADVIRDSISWERERDSGEARPPPPTYPAHFAYPPPDYSDLARTEPAAKGGPACNGYPPGHGGGSEPQANGGNGVLGHPGMEKESQPPPENRALLRNGHAASATLAKGDDSGEEKGSAEDSLRGVDGAEKGEGEEGDGERRQTWDKKLDFLLAIIGFAIDLGNVWRFPYICYKNGGGAFLIPYVLMLLFLGLPLFYMELALGQFHRKGPITIWTHICPMFRGIGFAICIVASFVGAYYNTIIAWSVYYLVMSLRSTLLYARCDNDWNTPLCVEPTNTVNRTNASVSAAAEFFQESANSPTPEEHPAPPSLPVPMANGRTTHPEGPMAQAISNEVATPSTNHKAHKNVFHVLEVHKSSGIDDLGSIRWQLLLCLIVVFIVIFFCCWKGTKSTGKAVWVTATLPFFVLLVLLIRGLTLPGAKNGVLFYLRPDFSRLGRVEVWVDAAAQIFFSLGPGFGALIALSSYNKFHNNCFRDALLTSCINCGTSFVAGVVVFSVLGYMAHITHTSVDTVATHGPGLVFVVYAEAISTLSGSVFWAVLFFLMLIALGLDSTFGGLEGVMTALADEFQLFKHRRTLVVAVVCGYCFLTGLPTITYGGNYFIYLMDTHAAPISLIFICFIEVIAVNWFYGVRRFAGDIYTMVGFKPSIFWLGCWTTVCPLSLSLLFVLSFVSYERLHLDSYVYPEWAEAVGWMVTCASIICIPACVVHSFITAPGSFSQPVLCVQRLRHMVTPRLDPRPVTTTAVSFLQHNGQVKAQWEVAVTDPRPAALV